MTGLQAGLAQLITSVGAQQFRQFSVHCSLIQSLLYQLVSEDVRRDSVKSLTIVQINNMHCSFLIH